MPIPSRSTAHGTGSRQPHSASGAGGRRRRILGRLVAGLALGGLLAAAAPAASDAQYFGQNKVRYDRFDFQVRETGRFDIYYYPRQGEAVDDVTRMAERWYERLARGLEFELRDPIPLMMYADHPDFQQTNVLEGRLGEGTGGVTEGFRNRVIMPFADTYADTDHVLGHELVHAFQFAMADTRAAGGLTALFRLPLWFVEGMAEYYSLGREFPLTEMWLRDAVLRDELPTLQDLTRDPQYFPYRWGHGFWAYVAGTYGDDRASELFRSALGEGISGGIRTTLDVSPDTLMARWREDLREAYREDVEARTPPTEVGDRLLDRERTGGRMNLAPSVSPDGGTVAFLTERDLFTIDLYLADAETGELRRRVVSSQANPHFDALAFIHAAASWSPDGDRLAVIVFADGTNKIALVDARSGRVRERLEVEGAGSLSHLAWSPDGRYIAASGLSQGTSDLFLVDLEEGTTEKLTEGRHSDLQPTWSPDGRTLAFVSDRREDTDLDRLRFADTGLTLMDVATREIEELGDRLGGRQIDPEFSPDGRSLYFIADPDGVSDVYRKDLTTGALYRVTEVATGVSGITERSEALSVSRDDGTLFFSVFHGGDQQVRRLDAAEAQGERVRPPQVEVARPGALPPRDRSADGFVMRYLLDPDLGLPAGVPGEDRTYRPSLSLEYISPVTVGVGVDQFGPVGFGSVLFIFTDMLGDHWLGASVAAQGEVRDLSGSLMYRNRDRRLNWGAGAGRQVLRTGFTESFRDGTEIVTRQTIRRFKQDQVVTELRYPFSRARRAELTLGGFRLSEERWRDDFRFTGDGRFIDQQREDLEAPPSLYTARGAAALVGDNAFFGFTAPVRGSRWRLEAGHVVGDLRYSTGLVDGRRYLFRNPFTLAGRVLQYGRYGGDAESDRLTPLFIGEETLVRGYALGTWEADECSPPPEGTPPGEAVGCPELNRLLGSRMGVLNVELRAPLFGAEEFGLLPAFIVPVDIAAFLDAGVAWQSGDAPELRFERDSPERIPVFSAGISSRIGVGANLALEIYWAYPFQRPRRGGHFGFQIAPGW